jgi:hypothetical protein
MRNGLLLPSTGSGGWRCNMEPEKGPSALSILTMPFVMTRGLTGYITAGAGSLIIQVVLAGLLGGLFVLKAYWRRITAFFARKKEADGAVELKEADGAVELEEADIEDKPEDKVDEDE